MEQTKSKIINIAKDIEVLAKKLQSSSPNEFMIISSEIVIQSSKLTFALGENHATRRSMPKNAKVVSPAKITLSKGRVYNRDDKGRFASNQAN